MNSTLAGSTTRVLLGCTASAADGATTATRCTTLHPCPAVPPALLPPGVCVCVQLLRLESLRQLPRLALSKMAGAQASCLMGLWGEIHRCWAAFDDEVLIWNYDEDVPEGSDPVDYRCVPPSRGSGEVGSEVLARVPHSPLRFDLRVLPRPLSPASLARSLIRGLGEPVVAVGLVPPRADVFDASVKVRARAHKTRRLQRASADARRRHRSPVAFRCPRPQHAPALIFSAVRAGGGHAAGGAAVCAHV
jgi:hypothetical protein